MKNASLVLFAVLIQAAVGIVLVTTALPGAPAAAAAARLALPLAALGLLVSLAHLGTPSGAYRALANLRSSWLSREVLLTGLFAALAACYGYHLTTPLVGTAAGAVGVAALLAQAMVYQLPTRPEWRHWSHLVAPQASAVLLGALTVALFDRATPALGSTVVVAAAAGLGAQVAWGLHQPRAAAGAIWFWTRLAGGVLLPALVGTAMALGAAPLLMITAALAGAVLGEVGGRSLYYRTGFEQTPQF